MIETRELKKGFGPQAVLRGVNLRIESGEALVIIGRSGSGKSVLLKLLIGLIRPDSGDVRVENESIVAMRERDLLRVRSQFGMLFQSAALFDSMNVADNIGFALQQSRRFTAREISVKVAEALEMVDLPGTEHKKPSELSGGMRKRVGLARAIIYRPQIILYDEPTTGLDPIVSDSIDQLIIRIGDRLNVTSIAVTHDMRSASRIGKRIVMLHEGRIHASGTPDEIFNSADPVVSRFVKGISDLREAPNQP